MSCLWYNMSVSSENKQSNTLLSNRCARMKFVINQAELKKLQVKVSKVVSDAWDSYKKILQWEYQTYSYDLWELRDSVKSELISNDTARVSTDKIQWFVDEFGRKPWGKMPPPDKLKWRAGRKLWDENLSYAVAKKIQRDGIKAKRTFSTTRENNKEKIYQKIAKDLWTTI